MKAMALLPLLLVVVGLAAAEETPVAQATGPMVIRVEPGSLADQGGLAPGDIIVRYKTARIRSTEELSAAITAHSHLTNDLIIVVNRFGDEQSFIVQGGKLGVQLRDIEVGSPLPVIPAQTVPAYDLTALRAGPQERWCRFLLDEVHVGYLHDEIALEDGVLRYNCELAFDGGERFGVNHFHVRIACQMRGGIPDFHNLTFRVPRNDLIYRCQREAFDDGTTGYTWSLTVDHEEMERGRMPDALGELVLPTYLENRLVAFLPAEEGACIHVRQMIDGEPRLGELVADQAVGSELVEWQGQETRVRVVQQQLFGAAGNRHWVGPDGRLLKSIYGGAATVLVEDRATATEGLARDLLKGMVGW